MSTSRDFSWREVVEKADGPERHKESLYPNVYEFTGGRTRRDSGPTKGIYEGTGT